MLVSDGNTGEERHKEVNVIRMDDKRAVVRKESRKLMEGMTDIFKVFKEIKMVFFYI